jgi:hypothetical protein
MDMWVLESYSVSALQSTCRANIRAMRCLVLPSLNTTRLEVLLRAYLQQVRMLTTVNRRPTRSAYHLTSIQQGRL